MSNTARLNLPNLVSGQSQKEITHNMALRRLDAFVQTAVESITLTAPPVGAEGSLYIVGAGASGAWEGKDKYLAHFDGGAWSFYVPFEGMRLWDKETSIAMVYKNAIWQQEISVQDKLAFFGAEPISKNSVVLNNTENAINNLVISTVYSQAEVQALRDKCEELANDVRVLKTALSNYGLV